MTDPPRVSGLPVDRFLQSVRLVDAAERLAAYLHLDVFGPPPVDVAELSAEPA